ncbi:MAG: DnaA/Hda family protein [Chlamydiota bacterium]
MKQWKDFLREIEKTLGQTSVEKWISPLKIVRFDAGNLYLEAESYFQVTFFEEHVRPLVKKNFFNSNHRPIQVHLDYPKKQSRKEDVKEESTFQIEANALHPEALLSSFYPSEKNQNTLDLVSELVGYDFISHKPKNPTLPLATFNPIYLYGPSGSGKTHLLMGCTRCLQELGFLTYFVKAKTFTDHVIQAIRLGRMQEFRKTYREVTVLLIDDIHELANKNATQEELFHTFNALHHMGSQIILTSNSPPQKLSSIEPRLTSRFEWGITLQLYPLGQEHMPTLIEKKILELGLILSPEIIQFLLTTFPLMKKWQKALEALTFHSHLDKEKKWTVSLVKEALQSLLLEEEKAKATPEKIIKITSDHFGITVEDLLGKTQTRECSLPRQIAMYLCKNQLHIPFTQIGKLFTRDHSTVMTSIKRIEEGIKNKSETTLSSVNEILKTLEEKTEGPLPFTTEGHPSISD